MTSWTESDSCCVGRQAQSINCLGVRKWPRVCAPPFCLLKWNLMLFDAQHWTRQMPVPKFTKGGDGERIIARESEGMEHRNVIPWTFHINRTFNFVRSFNALWSVSVVLVCRLHVYRSTGASAFAFAVSAVRTTHVCNALVIQPYNERRWILNAYIIHREMRPKCHGRCIEHTEASDRHHTTLRFHAHQPTRRPFIYIGRTIMWNGRECIAPVIRFRCGHMRTHRTTSCHKWCRKMSANFSPENENKIDAANTGIIKWISIFGVHNYRPKWTPTRHI